MKRLSLASLLLTISSASLVLAAVDYKDANISGINFTNSDFSGATVGTSASDSRTTTFNTSTVAHNYSGSNFSGMSIGLTGYLS